MRNTNRTRAWRLPLQVTSLLLVFGVAALGQPEASSTVVAGCAEAISCASEGVCEDKYGEECEEGTCTGTLTCIDGEEHALCENTVCDHEDIGCHVLVCVDAPE